MAAVACRYVFMLDVLSYRASTLWENGNYFIVSATQPDFRCLGVAPQYSLFQGPSVDNKK